MMKNSIIAIMVLLLVLGTSYGAADLDGDGKYDVEDYVADVGINPASVTGDAYLDSCGIQDLDGANQFTNAPVLYMIDNEITSIESGDFSGLSNLQILDLRYNQITSIESGDFSGLGNLQTLYLWDNQITSIESDDFSGLSSLQILDLRDNQITSIESGDFSGIGNLLSLELWHNQITSIESGDFSDLGSLLEVVLGNNQIASIESGDFSGLSNLQWLDQRNNQITSIESGDFSGLGSLQYLWLRENQITSLESGAFSGLGDLRYLHLQGNQFSVLNLDKANLSVLEQLSVDTSEIDSLILDDAILSQMSFDVILNAVSMISEASLVGMDLTYITSLENLLSLDLLEYLTVDPTLYAAWQGDLDAWAAFENHTLTVTPEPTTLGLLALGGLAILRRGSGQVVRRRSRKA